MTRYRKLPVQIEAVEFQGFRNEAPLFVASPWPSWLTEAWALGHPDSWRDTPVPGALVECSGQLLAVTLEGPLVVSPGDFIIRGVEGELYPCKPGIFAVTYEAAGSDPNLENCVPGRWRCAKCSFQLSSMSLNMGSGTVTMRDQPGEVCPNDGSPMWRVSYREAYEELCATANSERFAAICILERLVEPEGAAVTFLCENPEGTGPDNHAIEVSDGWTGYEPRRFYGRSRFDALCKAEDARIEALKAVA